MSRDIRRARTLRHAFGLRNHRFEYWQASRPDKPSAYIAFRVDNHRGRQFTPIETAADVVLFIQKNGVVDSALLNRAGDLFTDLFEFHTGGFGFVIRRVAANVTVAVGHEIEGNAKNHETVAVALLQGDQLRHFADTRRAPGRPKVDQHDFAAADRELQLSSIQSAE